jgi:hypothetical protein
MNKIKATAIAAMLASGIGIFAAQPAHAAQQVTGCAVYASTGNPVLGGGATATVYESRVGGWAVTRSAALDSSGCFLFSTQPNRNVYVLVQRSRNDATWGSYYYEGWSAMARPGSGTVNLGWVYVPRKYCTNGTWDANACSSLD